ncbi:dihydropteroate synthase [Siccirubricoccus sp. G192]|uniref:dihydropteroate synthase n=1 Tax=Siccirubricoccus sp. G192 TaxID=2849651 RepID=UPI0028128617|nr:dihydropteroate synthase [Siccirubricoccus sp. G192]
MTERWIEPLGLVSGPAAFHAVRRGAGLPLLGGPSAFLLVRLIEDGADQGVLPVDAIPEPWQDLLDPLTRRPAPFAGLGEPAGRPLVMGIVNVTPDSFSGDGLGVDAAAAIARGHAMLEAGADILDIGGRIHPPGRHPGRPGGGGPAHPAGGAGTRPRRARLRRYPQRRHHGGGAGGGGGDRQ